MGEFRANVTATMALIRRDWLVFKSYKLRIVAQLLSSFFSLTLFYFVSRLVTVEPFGTPDAYYAYAVIGLVILTVLNSTLGSPPARARQELVAGTFERVFLSGFGPVPSLVSMLLFPFVLSLFIAVVMLAFAGLVFGLPVTWDTAALAIPLFALGALSFMPFGIAMLGIIIVLKGAEQGVTWIVAAISLVSGLYFPVSLLPDWIQWASDVQPFTPATDLLRHVLVGTPLMDSAWVSIAKLIGFTVVLLPPSIWAVHKAIRVGQRKGTIIEY